MSILALIALIVAAGMMTTCLGRISKDYPYGTLRPATYCFCDHCNTKFTGIYTWPIIGYLLLGGKTKCCNQDIPVRYLTLELCSTAVNYFLFSELKQNPLICYTAICGFSIALFISFALFFHRTKIKVLNFIESLLLILLMNTPVFILIIAW